MQDIHLLWLVYLSHESLYTGSMLSPIRPGDPLCHQPKQPSVEKHPIQPTPGLPFWGVLGPIPWSTYDHLVNTSSVSTKLVGCASLISWMESMIHTQCHFMKLQRITQGVVIPTYNRIHPTKHNPRPLSMSKPCSDAQPAHQSVTRPTTNHNWLAIPASRPRLALLLKW